ncbi:MAG: hypothetical protein DWB44_08070 [Chloroflexi bacterium]|nr:hypothetical protein [Chloroflexota bacterium]
MTKFQDRAYLTGQQYSGANNLSARIRLHEQFTVTDVDLHRYLFDLLLAAAGSPGRAVAICGVRTATVCLLVGTLR